MADSNHDLSDLGAHPVDLSDLGGTPIDNKKQEASDSSIVPNVMNLASPSIAQSLIDTGKDAAGTVGAGVAGAGEGALGLIGGASRVGATAAEGADLANQALHGKVPDMLGAPAKWREYKQLIKNKQEEIQADSPWAYGIGEAGGALATAPLLPELGGARAAAALGKASPLVDKFLAGQVGGLASKAAGKATSGLIEAAPIGGIMGATNSEANSPMEFAKDVGSGVGSASLIGAGLRAGGELGAGAYEAAGNFAKESDYLQKIKHVFNLGKDKGVNIATTSGEDIAKLMIAKDIPNEVVNNWLAVDKMNGQKVGAAIDNAVEKGVTIDIGPEVQQATSNLFGKFIDNPNLEDLIDPKSKKIISLIYKKDPAAMTALTPIDAKALRDALYDLAENSKSISGEVSETAQRQGYKLASAIDQNLKANIPGYEEASARFSEFRSLVPETVLQPGVPLDARTKYLGDLRNKKASLLEKSKEMLKNAQMPGNAEESRAGLAELKQNYDQLKMTNPDAYKMLGGDNAFDALRDKSNLVSGMRQAMGHDPHESGKRALFGQLVGSGEGLGLGIANKAGLAARSVGQSAPVKQGLKLFTAGNDRLMQLAQSMKSKQGFGLLGEALEKSLNNKSDTLRNAVLFRMLQDPAYRGMLKSEGFDDIQEPGK